MDFSTTAIPGLIHFRPKPHRDKRGYFCRTFDSQVARRAGLDPESFVQDSQSRSRYGVVRGLHVRLGAGEGKLVRCSHGALFDVVVDLRPDSPAYRRWLTFDLDGWTQESIYVPPGCAHGFQAITETADTAYRIDRAHDPADDLTVAWNDPELDVPWPIPVTMLSESDQHALPLAELESELARVSASASAATLH